MVKFRIYLFGTFRIEQKGQPILLPTRKTVSLLAYLVLHPNAHTREKLATLFWGDSSDDGARGSLRKALNLMRNHLGNEIVLADREKVQLSPDYSLEIDTVKFEDQASHFLSAQNPDINGVDFDLYKGELLSDFYDEWILAEREHYHTLYIKASLRAVEHHRAQSEYELAIQHARKVLMFEAANEQAFQHLIFCHAALGDRNGALQQYEACQRALQTELGVEPARETQGLYNWIKQSASDIPPLAARVTNLPIPISSFVGRNRELAEIKQLLSNARLLTLSGVGGSGKTRLAIRTATDLIDSFKDGVWWVDLSSLADESLVPQSVAKALGIKESHQKNQIESIHDVIQPKELLLVMDNCEHLVHACAQLVAGLLTQCPRLKILTTSREALRVDGEIVYGVPTLPTPDIDKISLAELLLNYESVKLFVERARAIQSGFTFDNRTALSVAQICARLDGIPLAIELAAARVRTMSVEQIAAHLNDTFRLLVGGNRTLVPRQQTLSGTISWSYNLLDAYEKKLFCRLAVFRRGFTLEAAESVCNISNGLPFELVDGVEALVDKSLLKHEANGDEPRFFMLETIREYAFEMLSKSDEVDMLHRNHFDYFLKFSKLAQSFLEKSEQASWLNRLEKEHDNLRAAFQWAKENKLILPGAELVNALGLFWNIRGFLTEGRAHLAEILSHHDDLSDSSLHFQLLNQAALLARFQGDYTSASALINKSLSISRQAANTHAIADALSSLGFVLLHQEKLETAQGYYLEALDIYRELNNEQGMADSFSHLGLIELCRENYETAHQYHMDSLTIWERLDDKQGIAWALRHLGHIVFHEHQYSRARDFFEKSLGIALELRSKLQIVYALEGFASLLVVFGKAEQALTLAGFCDELRRSTDMPLSPVESVIFKRTLIPAWQSTDSQDLSIAQRQGQGMDLDEAVKYARTEVYV